MVIGKIYVVSVAVLKAKDDPPISGHRNGPQPFEFSLERVKVKARKGHVSNFRRLVKAGQDAFDPAYVRRRDTAMIVLLAKSSKTAVPKRRSVRRLFNLDPTIIDQDLAIPAERPHGPNGKLSLHNLPRRKGQKPLVACLRERVSFRAGSGWATNSLSSCFKHF